MMSAEPIKLLGIPGSLREHSFNRALIKAAQDVAPEGVEVTMFLLHDIPFYNADVEEAGAPEAVQRLREAIEGADGVLFSTPQYNRSVPGVLKNAIDWASRPVRVGCLVGKPAAIIGATSGMSAVAFARADLRRILEVCSMEVLPELEIGLTESADHIQEGEVVSAEVREEVRAILDAFVDFIQQPEAAQAAD